MAVGLEGAHAELVGQGEGLAVVAGNGLDLGGSAVRGDLSQEPQGPGLMAAFVVLTGVIEGTPGKLARLPTAPVSRYASLTQRNGDDDCDPCIKTDGSIACSSSGRAWLDWLAWAYAAPRAVVRSANMRG